jgi:hypothetical protein
VEVFISQRRYKNWDLAKDLLVALDLLWLLPEDRFLVLVNALDERVPKELHLAFFKALGLFAFAFTFPFFLSLHCVVILLILELS